MRALATLVTRVVWVALIVSMPAAAYAQATIAGVVRDTSGAVLPGVTVEAASPALIEKVRSVVTDGTGQFQIVNLVPGTYSVTFTLPGFNTRRQRVIDREVIDTIPTSRTAYDLASLIPGVSRGGLTSQDVGGSSSSGNPIGSVGIHGSRTGDQVMLRNGMLNANPVLAQNNTFGTAWLRPTSIFPARFAKVSLQLDF